MSCPNCDSADVVDYWKIKANQTGTLAELVLQLHYPDARKCGDCGLVWWTQRQHDDVREIRQREPHQPTLMPCSPCPDCAHLHRLSKCTCGCTNQEWR